ncbi:pilus assembly protein TadG-related protein [Streptomyces sp. LHD-70]|nr:Rv3654c family TadE-like protein [Streptomyces sp. LHD-70]MDQ8706700.1 pilus assembly protein TadG-related protein [Streptomyces sp. LHD-70]
MAAGARAGGRAGAGRVRADGRSAWADRRTRGSPWSGPGGERGSATVWAVMVAAALCAVFGGVLLLTQAVLARHRAGGAADLAALAAADRALRGRQEACAGAERVAAEQGAEVVRCTVRGEIADVTVRARAGSFRAQLRARAGPPGAGLSGAGPSADPGRPSPGRAQPARASPGGAVPSAAPGRASPRRERGSGAPKEPVPQVPP